MDNKYMPMPIADLVYNLVKFFYFSVHINFDNFTATHTPTHTPHPHSYTTQLNKDLIGEIHLLSQTGPFSIPVRCLTKQCLVSVEGNDC